MAKNDREWPQHSSQYLGDISALCFVHLPSSLSSFPYLLAGSGSQVMLYDLGVGKLIRSFQVFDGIRVHGISCDFVSSKEGSSSTEITYRVSMYGEKKVKLFNFELVLESRERLATGEDLSLVHSLPSLIHWVLDVAFLKDCDGSHCVAIGCSDNSVRVWDIAKAKIIYEVHSPDRCLLYSMRLWGKDLEALLIASGTIYNEIIVWKMARESISTPSSLKEDYSKLNGSSAGCVEQNHQQHKAFHICRLTGHEGSIFRIEWSSDGSKLVSVSDDRSARIWTVRAEQKDSGSIVDIVGPVLYGHSARVWDCCITDSIIITASEDCTCRVWGSGGKQLKMIKEHIGRGIWRCLYDPLSSLLVTGGFDSAIKVHQLNTSLSGSPEAYPKAKDSNDRTEIFSLHIPNLPKNHGLLDSKSEYVRCLCFTREDTLYVATNQGYLYHARLADANNVKFTKVVQLSEETQIVCMDLLSEKKSDYHDEIDDWVALGDGKGNATIVRVVGDICAPELGLTLTWSAGTERQLLGIYWCKSLGYRFVFTADPRGSLKLWRLSDPSLSSFNDSEKTYNVSQIAEFRSCFGVRLMCLDASVSDEVLVCGDLRGNLILFPLSKQISLGSFAAPEEDISPQIYFKGAHGISTVSNISVATLGANQMEIRSTGGDGCICYLEYDKARESLEFLGLKQVKELSLIHSVSGANNSEDLMCCNYAAGFASADFIIWNLISEAKVVQIPCGGWRRPHSYLLGDVPEIKFCFAYVKDEVIHIHRHWIAESEQKIFPQNLHMQFHGREMHTLCFISENLQVGGNKKSPFLSSWIATGCEDGTVRLTRYSPGVEGWSASKLLGEHVGGSAVRSICSVSEVHLVSSVVDNKPEEINGKGIAAQDKENPFLLISVGAKRVLTSWLLRNRNADPAEETLVEQKLENNGDYKLPFGASPSLSFQWLSTDMPTKSTCAHVKTVDTGKTLAIGKNDGSMKFDTNTGSGCGESVRMESNSCLEDKYEDDWRYLAVTAFLVKCRGSRLTICFVVVACSDATLVLRALVLPHRLWFDVAQLVSVSSPVLTLQHIIVPIHVASRECVQIGSVYFVISGATDGSIAFWDLTESVEAFVRQVSSFQVEKFIDCQKRPRTGRGSQGGRRRRTLSSTKPKKIPGNNLVCTKAGEEAYCNMQANAKNDATEISNNVDNSTMKTIDKASPEPESNTVDYASEIYEIQPMRVLNKVHQSGVNCLYLSDIKKFPGSENGFEFYVVSGGDDQAIHCLRIDLLLQPRCQNSKIEKPDLKESIPEFTEVHNLTYYGEKVNQYYTIRFVNHHNVLSAHSSAIKGIWTDGMWIFSTGLDQRVRVWLIEEHGKLTEHAHLIVSVPEPEALDARACGRNHYQIAVAGRGMQVVEFCASHDVVRND